MKRMNIILKKEVNHKPLSFPLAQYSHVQDEGLSVLPAIQGYCGDYRNNVCSKALSRNCGTSFMSVTAYLEGQLIATGGTRDRVGNIACSKHVLYD